MINFKKGDKPKLFGRITAASDFTIDFPFQADENTDTVRSATFGIAGPLAFSISYPFAIFRTANDVFNCLLNKQVGYEDIRPPNIVEGAFGNQHTITFRLNSLVKEVLIDGIVVGTRTPTEAKRDNSAFVKFGQPVDADLYFSSPSDIDAFTGNIDAVFKAIYSNVDDKPMPESVFDVKELHPNYVAYSSDYSNVPHAFEQILNAPDPNYHPRSVVPQIACGINLRYAVGLGNIPMTDAVMIQKTVDLQRLLTKKCNYAIRFSDALGETAEEKRDNKPCLTESLANLALELPAARLDVTTAWAHIRPFNGKTPMNKSKIGVNMDLNLLNPDVDIYDDYAAAIQEICLRKGIDINRIGLHIENNEIGEMNFQTKVNGVYSATNHIVDSDVYQQIINKLLSKLRLRFPGLKFSSEYDVHYPFWDTNQKLFEYRIKISINGYGSCSMYCNQSWVWYDHQSNQRGLGFLLQSKDEEIKQGHPYNYPFISGGWDAIEEKNLGCAQLLSLYKIAIAAGAINIFPSYFTLTGAGNTGFQKDQSYAKDLIMPPFAQAVFSNPDIWDLIVNGDLLEGDIRVQYNNQGFMSLNSHSKAIKTVVRKHKTLDRYLIVSAHMPLHRNKTKTPKPVDCYITINGVKVTFKSRRQGSVFIYEPGKQLRQYDGWHRAAHIGWWNHPSVAGREAED